MLQPKLHLLRNIFYGATPEQHHDGVRWYKLALLTATEMALRYEVPVAVAAGVIAALSPRKTWVQNLRLAHECLSGERPRTIGKHADTAVRIRDHGVGGWLKGSKTHAFYRAIMGDLDAVVLDVWMLRALGLSTNKLTPKQYAALAETVRAEAYMVGAHPAEYQAIVWCAIRGKSF